MTETKRYKYENDPFPGIPPTLLNSADIRAYVEYCQIVSGFDPKHLKTASYEIFCKGDVYWCEPDGKKTHKARIDEGNPFPIPGNATVYVAPDVTFEVPDFIALRFNLTIRLVHQGILLGTGPLVDPGFAGRLLIPLHNLTSEKVVLLAGEGLIWVEFTKLSAPQPDYLGKKYEYISFPQEKRNLSIEKYFALAGDAPQASALQRALQQSEEIKAASQKTSHLTILGLVITGLAVFIALYQTYGQFVGVVRDATQHIVDSKKTLDEQKAEIEKQVAVGDRARQKNTREIDERVRALEEKILSLEKGAKRNGK